MRQEGRDMLLDRLSNVPLGFFYGLPITKASGQGRTVGG